MTERREDGRRRTRSFVLGGIVGASAMAAEMRRRQRRRKRRPAGLAAFEGAPCYRESAEPERSDGP